MFNQNVGVRGRAAVTIINNGKVKEFVDAKKTLRSGQFCNNLILDNLLAFLAGDNNPTTSTRIKIGTGTTAPAVSQTALVNVFNPVGGAPAPVRTESVSAAGGVVTLTVKYVATYPLGAVDAILAEVGLLFTSAADNTANVHTRLLFTDGGSPTTIPVTTEDQLIITYEIDYVYADTTAVATVSGTVDGVPTNIDIQGFTNGYANQSQIQLHILMQQLGSGPGIVGIRNDSALGTPNESPSVGWSNVNINYVQRLNVSGGKELDVTISTTNGNLSGGIRAMRSSGNTNSAYKWLFTPAFDKNSDRQLVLTFRRTYGRI